MARAGDWAAHLAAPSGSGEIDAFRASASTGRPLGSSTFVAKLEAELGRKLGRRKPGPKPKIAEGVQADLY